MPASKPCTPTSKTSMSNDNFVKVFDVLDSGYKAWFFPKLGLGFLAFGVIILLFQKLTGINIVFKSKLETFSFFVFFMVWTSIAFFVPYSDHLRYIAVAQQNRCRVVEGPVENFVP